MKMKLVKCIAATAAMTAIAGTAQAQDSNIYANIGGEALDVFGASGNVVGRVGYDFHQYFAVETEGAVGVIDDNDGFKLDFRVAAYGRVKAPIGEQFEIFGRLGYYYAEAEGGNADDIAFGGGIEYFLSPKKRHSVRLEYTSLEFDGGINADVYSLAYGIHF